ncbi:TIGR02452 family protein [Streptomyces sp. S1A]|uniref:TIGR02452 family protein n=1 Tax=Streptomyces sp. ICN903 TaxID=2964654 RepID=UPI001EDC194E|nr:TIGR02452 family protein [Streptomyces sp. ICN903]MCG3040552.1 TIGR02452 family protein [Streptomyces sp. ICN903]
MSARLRGIAKQTEEIVERGRYTAPGGREVSIAGAVAAAMEGTALFGPGPVPVPEPGAGAGAGERLPTVFEVTGESSLEAARRLVGAGPGDVPAPGGPVAVLNFASARNPGGGYLNGAQAQEEALCRASALYVCLLRAPGYYEHHRAERSPFYSDRVIHSPGVPVFRDDHGELLEEPFEAGFLTSPAPNAGVIERRAPEEAGRIPGALLVRAERVLEVAAAQGYRRLVLGAWGCGVFRNDPAVVAGVFRSHLADGGRFAGRFAHVVFAVLDRRADSPTRAAFHRAFAGLAG